jgi:hypothetical protein
MASELVVSQELQTQEKVIEKNIDGFYAVGQALTRIRDEKLYAPAYSSFKDYCNERWEFSRSYAYRLMNAVVTVDKIKALPEESVSPMGDTDDVPQVPMNERQARAVAAEMAEETSEPEESREPGDDDEEYPPRCKIVDANGDRVYLTLESAFKKRSDFGSAERTVRRLSAELVKELKPGDGGSRFDSLSFGQAMTRAADLLASGAPYAICPFYNGIGECVAIKKIKCKTCGGRGWVTKPQYEEATR